MPRIWKPRNHTLYRIASIALFRALLTQCRAAIHLNHEQITAAQNIVRNRFKANAYEVSTVRTKHMYLAGYHALDLLDASVAGDEAATDKIKDLIGKTPNALKEAPKPKQSKEERRRKRQEEQGHDPKSLASLPEGMKMLDVRPLPEVSGTRRAPSFTVANKIPFLRYKKPHPPNLERVIRQKLDRKQKRIDYSHVMQGYHVPLASMEDQWDRLLAQQNHIQFDQTREEPKWAWAMREQLKVVETHMHEDKERTWDMAKKMQAILDQERILVEKEAKHLATRDQESS